MIDSEYIKYAIRRAKKTQQEVADALKVSREWVNTQINNPSPAFIKRLETEAGIDLTSVNFDNAEKRVPYYDIDATAGNTTIFAEDGPEYIKQYITVPAFNDCEMFINVSGNSMYPKYCSGELVALKKIEDFEVVAYGEAYLLVTKEQRLLKYIRKGKDKDHWLLMSENPEFDSFEVPRKKVLHLYIVKGKITKNII